MKKSVLRAKRKAERREDEVKPNTGNKIETKRKSTSRRTSIKKSKGDK